ncbi:MAG TPA: PAS domain-containing sensor histidine kinase [Thermodesulfobacteriaceae bacterium]|nr:PAS domain-containing sensor histidine kinase [Thermodesulfobacteriaceae bacterium]
MNSEDRLGYISKEKLYDLLTMGMPVGFFIVDRDLTIIDFNEAAEKITGWPREEAIGKKCSEVLKSNLCSGACPLKSEGEKGKHHIGLEATIKTRFGTELPVFLSSSALLDDRGGMIAGIELFRDASDRKKLETQRKNFISLFAHDLKIPVVLTGGLVTRLLQEKAGRLTDKQRKYLLAIQRENQKLDRYIHDFLEILRVETGYLQMSRVACCMEDILAGVAESFQVRANEKNIAIVLDFPNKLPLIDVDKYQIERVFNNLVDNAIKYSPSGSTILVKAWEEGDSIMIEIRDQGPGIPAEDLPHIFEYFFRSSVSGKETAGIGLGLASVRGIVEAHGGRIWAKSKVGRGTSFFIQLPR